MPEEAIEAIYLATLMQGGEKECPVYYAVYITEKMRDDNIFYSVMLECKLAQGTWEAFVQGYS